VRPRAGRGGGGDGGRREDPEVGRGGHRSGPHRRRCRFFPTWPPPIPSAGCSPPPFAASRRKPSGCCGLGARGLLLKTEPARGNPDRLPDSPPRPDLRQPGTHHALLKTPAERASGVLGAAEWTVSPTASCGCSNCWGFGLSKREVAARLGPQFARPWRATGRRFQHRLGLESAAALAQYACAWAQRGLRAGRPHPNGSALGERA